MTIQKAPASRKPPGAVTCPHCNLGMVTKPHDFFPQTSSMQETCGWCRGRGWVGDKDDPQVRAIAAYLFKSTFGYDIPELPLNEGIQAVEILTLIHTDPAFRPACDRPTPGWEHFKPEDIQGGG